MDQMEDEDKLILWLKENFVYLISGLLLGLAVILGTNFYQSSQVNLQHELSLQYQKTLRFYKTGDFDRYLIEAKKISDDNPDNIYTAMLNLYSAKYYHDQNKLDEAEKYLLSIV